MRLSLLCDPAFYTVQTRSMRLPMLVPGTNYQFSTFVQVVTDAPAASTIHVFASHEDSPVPCMTAVVSMPVSEGLATVR